VNRKADFFYKRNRFESRIGMLYSADDSSHQTGSRRHICLPALWHIAPVIPSSCCRERRLTSLVLTSGRPTVQTWIPSTTRSGASWINGVDELKQRLHDVWHGVQQHIIDLAVSQWRQRLTAWVRAHGRHFEHLLWACITQTWVESQYVRINYCWALFIKITKSCLRLNLRIFRFNNFPR